MTKNQISCVWCGNSKISIAHPRKTHDNPRSAKIVGFAWVKIVKFTIPTPKPRFLIAVMNDIDVRGYTHSP